ncbi:hypothetical protein I4U23_009470 [Adineta vaga]|nr:hypothetical protein I4U23_009470 [Adineta vaga]
MSIIYILRILLIFGVCDILFQFVQTSEGENRLVHYLFSEQGYNPLVRPTQHSNETVLVSFGLLLVQLIHVYEKEQIMKTNTWLHMKWYDPQLRWNPERYGGVDQISVPYTNVWTPDVVLFNNAGEVQWIPPAIYKSSCRIDVKFFPFDTQRCEMRFASWTYNAREVAFTHYSEEREKNFEITKLLTQQAISVTSDEPYKDDYLESGTWDVISIPSKFVHYYSNASSLSPDYIEIVFSIEMSRKTLYYTVNLIVPTGLMGILICIVFCLPTAAGEKMTLCMSILLALNLFQLLVTKILPPTSAVVPLIAKYLLFTFSLNVLVIVNTVIITNFYYRTPMTHTMPGWVRRFFIHILPRLLWMESPKLKAKRQQYEMTTIMNKMEKSVILQNPIHTIDETVQTKPNSKTKTTHSPKEQRPNRESDASLVTYMNDKRRTSTLLLKPMAYSKPSSFQNPKRKYFFFEEEKRLVPVHSKSKPKQSRHQLQVEQMRRELTQALENIRYIATHCEQESLIESVRDEWKFIATVIDRLQFVIFLTVTICGSFALLSEGSYVFRFGSSDSQKLIRFSNPNTTVHELTRTARN